MKRHEVCPKCGGELWYGFRCGKCQRNVNQIDPEIDSTVESVEYWPSGRIKKIVKRKGYVPISF